MRVVVLLALSVLLSGCNGVYSDTPLAANLYVAKPVFMRAGQWTLGEPDCGPARKAAGEDCSTSGVIFDKQGRGLLRQPEGTYRLIFAPGDPGLIQVRQPKARPRYLYLGARPTRFDDQGQVTEMSAWIAQCGPLPDKGLDRKPNGDSSRDAKAFVTDRPYPGLQLRDTICIATDVAAVRAAARASEDPKAMVLKWVADR